MMMSPHYPQMDASAVQMMQNLSLVHPGEQGRYVQPGLPAGMAMPGFQGVPYGYMPGTPSMPQAVPPSSMQVQSSQEVKFLVQKLHLHVKDARDILAVMKGVRFIIREERPSVLLMLPVEYSIPFGKALD